MLRHFKPSHTKLTLLSAGLAVTAQIMSTENNNPKVADMAGKASPWFVRATLILGLTGIRRTPGVVRPLINGAFGAFGSAIAIDQVLAA